MKEMKREICILEDKKCTDCGECNLCDLDENKTCDNCGKCIDSDAESRAIQVDGVYLDL